MRLARALCVLAILTALWAPSSASAAVNELTSPKVSPGAGTTATGFNFQVRYEGRFDAVSVHVAVAGRAIRMSLESGSLASGSWAAVATLPAGTWPTTFAAVATQGPLPSLNGPSVSVVVAATPLPSPSPTPQPEPEPASAPSTATTRPPAAAPAPVPAPASAATTPGQPELDGEVAASADEAPAPSGGPSSPQAADAERAAGATNAATAATGADAPTTGAGLVGMVLVVGLVGVAAVGIIGTLLLIAGRRRPSPEPPVVAAPSTAATDERPAEHRVPRRAPPRLADDPIVAALGVDDEMAARRAIRRAERVDRELGSTANGFAGRGRRP